MPEPLLILELIRAVGCLLVDDGEVEWRRDVLEDGEWPRYEWVELCGGDARIAGQAESLATMWMDELSPVRLEWEAGLTESLNVGNWSAVERAQVHYARAVQRLLRRSAREYGVKLDWDLETLDVREGTHSLRAFAVALFISRSLQLAAAPAPGANARRALGSAKGKVRAARTR